MLQVTNFVQKISRLEVTNSLNSKCFIITFVYTSTEIKLFLSNKILSLDIKLIFIVATKL